MKAAQATRSPSPLVSVRINVSLCRKGRPRRVSMLARPSGRVADHRRHGQELRADAQAGPRRRVDVDLEADPVIADGEIDDAAQAGEAIHVAHGEDRGALEALQQPADLPAER